MKVSKPPVRGLRTYWDEEDITYYFEADEDGWVLRQVSLSGSEHIRSLVDHLSSLPHVAIDEAIGGVDSSITGGARCAAT